MTLENAPDRVQAGAKLTELRIRGLQAVNELQRLKDEFTALRDQVTADAAGEFQTGDVANVATRIAELRAAVQGFASAWAAPP